MKMQGYQGFMTDHIVGICRFSFLGRGDWGAYAGTERGSDAEAQARDQVAATLYEPGRMAQRFRTFETLTLPSILAQEHRDFSFVVLTSNAMPAQYRTRLAALCAQDARIHLLVSDAATTGVGIDPLLARIGQETGKRLVQFRLDDDDCLSIEYTAALHQASKAARDYNAFAFSMPRALLATRYAGAAPARYDFMKPFHSAGAALRPVSTQHNIFSFGHYALARRFPCISDPRVPGSLQVKLEGHDSKQVIPSRSNGLTPMDGPVFSRTLARHFPFVDETAFEALLQD